MLRSFLLLLLPLALVVLTSNAAVAEVGSYPTPAECQQVIDAYHGPCGHTEGDAKLSGLLLQLAPPANPFGFTAYVAECATSTIPTYTDHERLFVWLSRYDRDPAQAWSDLAAWPGRGEVWPNSLRRVALVLLWGEDKELRQDLVPLLQVGADAATERLALQILTDSYPDPFARGLSTDLDATGTLYRAAFAEAGILPLCLTCPAEARGTDVEVAWAQTFLAIHPRALPTAPKALVKLPQVQLWLERYTADEPLTRAQAALVLWRLQTREAPR